MKAPDDLANDTPLCVAIYAASGRLRKICRVHQARPEDEHTVIFDEPCLVEHGEELVLGRFVPNGRTAT